MVLIAITIAIETPGGGRPRPGYTRPVAAVDEPVASASIAQVHRATLADGREVYYSLDLDRVMEALDDLEPIEQFLEAVRTLIVEDDV